MDDERITRIARALCRSARMDPDSIVPPERAAERRAMMERQGFSAGSAPAWTLFRDAATTFVRRHDEAVVAPL